MAAAASALASAASASALAASALASAASALASAASASALAAAACSVAARRAHSSPSSLPRARARSTSSRASLSAYVACGEQACK